MNRIVVFLVVLFAANNRAGSQTLFSIDEAINDYAVNLEKLIPKDKGVAIAAFETDNSILSDYFLDTMLEYIWLRCNAEVYERSKLETLQKELNFSLSGKISDETALRIGHFVGVGTIIYGSMKIIGSDYRMTIRATSVETGRVLFPKSYDLKKDNRLAGLLNNRNNNTASNLLKFEYYYLGNSRRYWYQTSITEWIEEYPNGDKTYFVFDYEFILDGVKGIVLKYSSRYVANSFRVFIPDKTEKQRGIKWNNDPSKLKWDYGGEITYL